MNENKTFLATIALWVMAATVGCPCPPTPEPSVCADGEDPELTLTLEDQHAAVWMTLDNSFVGSDTLGSTGVCAASEAEEDNFGRCSSYRSPLISHGDGGTIWPGLMFQLGAIDNPLGKEYYYDSVTLTYADDTSDNYPRSSDEALWIDVYPAGPCVIDALHAYAMFRNEIVVTDCDGVVTDPATNDDGDSLASCLRNRSLHASFVPDAGLVTVWPDANMYALETSLGGHGHTSFVFSFCDALVVDVWKNGCFEQQRDDVVAIEINYSTGGGSDHSIYHENPLDGGVIVTSP